MLSNATLRYAILFGLPLVCITRGDIIFYVGVEMRVGLIATAGDSVAGRLSAQAS